MPRLSSMRVGLIALSFAIVSFLAPDVLADARVSGTASGARFSCFGMPTCSGTVSTVITGDQCSNSFVFSTGVVLTGLDLSHPGALSGTFTIATNQTTFTTNADGTCAYQTGPGATWPYTGTWNGTQGSLVINGTAYSGAPQQILATFTASVSSSSPVFPMTVTGSMTPTATNVSATIQPRPQDVGMTGSIYVFAHAPSNLVSGATSIKRAPASPPVTAAPDDAIVCVLAQVNSNGQLVAVSTSTMQAYLTGVLGSQNQAITILNNVPTPNIAGATVYVGYGSSAASMLSSGVYQTAVSVPGGVQCTANLAASPAPEAPGALTGLWWNANESGWGIHFTQRGNNVFAAWYTYDASGNPKWYVASNCIGASGSSGTCSGSLYQVNGPTFFGADFHSNLVNVVTAGSLTVNFQNADSASMTYTVGTQTRTVAITRQPLGTGTTPAAVDYSDLWWNPNESGWGMAMAQQFGNIFLAWYVYDKAGKPVWYVASNCVLSGSSCSGSLYRTTGPAFGPTFDSTQIHVFPVGSAIVSFVDANNAVLSYTVDGVSSTKTVTRQVF
jgi:hypothetical protein